jgi:hypothetical protein
LHPVEIGSISRRFSAPTLSVEEPSEKYEVESDTDLLGPDDGIALIAQRTYLHRDERSDRKPREQQPSDKPVDSTVQS